MEEGRKLREEQYAALKDKEWEDTLRREAELHRSAHTCWASQMGAGSAEHLHASQLVDPSHAHCAEC